MIYRVLRFMYVFRRDDISHKVGLSIDITVEFGGLEPPHEIDHQRDSPKLNVWCGLMHGRILSLVIFAERSISGDV